MLLKELIRMVPEACDEAVQLSGNRRPHENLSPVMNVMHELFFFRSRGIR
jgi:hypothetical protein